MSRNDNHTDFEQHAAELSEKDVMAFDQSNHFASTTDQISVHAYAAILCTNGTATCRLEGKEFEIRKNDIFLYSPGLIIDDTMASNDFCFCGFYMSLNFLRSIFLLDDYAWDVKFLLDESPIIPLDAQDAERIYHDHQFLRYKLSLPQKPHHKEMINLLLQSVIYEFFDCIKPKLKIDAYVMTSSKQIFKRFMSIVGTDTPVHRSVAYYADRLCITPKYLSIVCKKHSGDTASNIINSYTIKHIKQKLLTTNLSIKEIAAACGFENLSFFGRYVYRQLGMSPREYRKIACK